MNQDRAKEIFYPAANMNPPQHLTDQSHLFLRDKQAWENAIAAYSGPDPLELWYNYICWYDYNIQVDPENKFRESLEKCLTIFEHNEDYKQDTRVVKLWVKYIDLQPNPLNLYQILYQRNIGTQCSCFYIGWAHYYDSANAFKQAESVYNLGFQAKAEPYSELQDAHTKFRLSLSQRMLYDDNSSKKRSASHLNEQRQQITTLTPHNNKKPRTDSSSSTEDHESISSQQTTTTNTSVQSQQPVTVAQPQPIQQPQTQQPPQSPQFQQADTSYSNSAPTTNSSEQCNLKNSAYVISSSLNYIYDETHTSLQDDSPAMVEYLLENVRIPANYSRYTKNNHEVWKPLICLEEPYDPNRRCFYQKSLVYPGDGTEVSPEEIRARKWSKRLQELREIRARELQQQQQQQHKQEKLAASHHHQPRSYSSEMIDTGVAVQASTSGLQRPHTYVNYEEQIEASTIRFSTDSNGATKNKKITIKFRREKADQNTTGYASQSNYTVEQVEKPYEQQQYDQYKVHNHKAKYDYSAGNISQQASYPSSTETLSRQSPASTSTPKPKKIRKIKFVNNYDDPSKYSAASGSNNHSRNTDYLNSSYKSKQATATVSRNQFEDANLLLSIASMHTNGTGTTPPSLATKVPSSSSSSSTATTAVNSSEALTYQDDSMSNSEFQSTFTENSHLSNSSCSTPIRKLSQTFSKTSTPSYFRSLKKHTSNLSLQNDDSMCSYEQNSFFASEHNDELKQKRLEKAITTIENHMAKAAIDPFSSELCKAFLTKIDFPSRDTNNVYKLVNNPIPKLANTKTTTLDSNQYSIEKEVGRGSYGSVYKAVNVQTGAVVALKYQKPPNTWEVYICTEVRKRIQNYDILAGFMDISSAVIAPNASILVTEFSVYGSLLDINNRLRQATKKVMHESLVMHFSSQILSIVSHLHSCNIIHADIKPDNFLLMRVPNSDTHIPSLRLIDFGCAIDMNLFPEDTQFKKVIQTDGFTCIEMQEGKPWSYQTDLFCIAGTIHVMLFGEYMQLVKKFGTWDIKQKLPRYLKKQVWTEFFSKMLNIKDVDNMPNLLQMKSLLDEASCKMDSELQTQIRTLSNLLHRR